MAEESSMADQTFGQPADSKTGADTSKTLRDQAAEAGRDLKNRGADFAETSGQALRDQAADLAESARDMASDAATRATDKLKEAASEQKAAGAEYVGKLADTIRRAAGEFDNDLPIAAKYIRKAATQVESVSDSLRTGDFNDIVQGAQSFARRQPTAFLGLSVLAGFAAIRFLKSSSETSATSPADKRRSP
jgi:gas vesicle protein